MGGTSFKIGEVVGEWRILSEPTRESAAGKFLSKVECTLCGFSCTKAMVRSKLLRKKCATDRKERSCMADASGRAFSKINVQCANCGTAMSVAANKAHQANLCSTVCRKARAASNATYRRQSSATSHLLSLLAQAKSRSAKKGIEFSLSRDFILDLYAKQGGKCALTGRSFIASKSPGNSRTHMNTVTIDKIDPNKGYTPDNVQLLTYMANVCKNAFSTADVVEFAKDVIATSKTETGKEGSGP